MKLGYLLPHQMIEIFRVTEAERRSRYVRTPDHWWDYEVPRGLLVDLPPVLTYAGWSLIRKRDSEVWSVFYTEWITRVACCWLWEVYDNYRLFALPPAVRYHLRRLRLDSVLGSYANQEDLRALVGVIEKVQWANVPTANQQRGHTAGPNLSSGKEDRYGDWLYYDPWEQEEICVVAAAERRTAERGIPEGHRVGYAFSPEPD